MKEHIKLIATAVRKNAEQIANDYDYPPDLGGMCLIVSNSLYKVLNRAGHHAKLAAGLYLPLANGFDFNHCWVETDHWFIDLTATQFEIPSKVYIAKCRPKNYLLKRYYKCSRDWRPWPHDQKPNSKYNDILERIPEALWARLNAAINVQMMK